MILRKILSARYIFCLGVLFLNGFISLAENSKEKEYIKVYLDQVPVNESDRPLITGIDVDKLLRRYISDYDKFLREPMGVFGNGIVIELYVKRDPNDRLKGIDGTSILLPENQRFIKMTIGAHPSHRDAIIAPTRVLEQGIPRLIPPDENDPGYISWDCSSNSDTFEHYRFVRDNVYIAIQLSKLFDPPSFVKRLDNDLKNGGEGIMKGDKPAPPIIEGNDFPGDVVQWNEGKSQLKLNAYDPNKRVFYAVMWLEDINRPITYPNMRINNQEMPPQVSWNPPGIVEFTKHTPFNRVVELNAVAANDLCVVSEIWKKKVLIKTP